MTKTLDPGARLDGLRLWLSRHYDLEGQLSPLGGENQNFLCVTPDGRRFVLKLGASLDARSDAFLEHAVVERAETAGMAVGLPRTVPPAAGGIVAAGEGGELGFAFGRLLTYVPGIRWLDAPPATPARREHFGRVLAGLDAALDGFAPPGSVRTHAWDLAAAGQHRHRVACVATPEQRRLAEAMFHLWAAAARPRLAGLPHSLIHGDPNDENVLVDGDRVVGVIDFGDAIHNPTICDLAIALAYSLLDQPDPLAAGADVVAGYHAVRPLDPAELDVLFPLVCGRLAVSVTIAAERRRVDATRSNWFITEERAWRLIDKLAAVDPAIARVELARGLPPELRTGRASRGSTEVDVLLAARRTHLGAALSISYRQPLKIVRGEGQYLFDHRGQPYLDLVNNVCHVGHCHPRIVDAGRRQLGRLNTNTRYLYDELTDFAGRLAATLPDPLRVCFFVNSGSEANELAWRLARAHTKRRDVLVVDGAYHGNTTTLIAMSPYKFLGKGGGGSSESWVHVVPVPDGYRGTRRGHDRATGEAYGHDVDVAIAAARAPIAGFLVESLMSCGGQIDPPPGYLETAFQHVRRAGGVCIVDEVQVGFGRVGSHFWGFERQGVVPDIVVMGKSIGNGHPIGAVVTTPEISASFSGMEFFSTFGGNPVSCAMGLAVLDVIRDEHLQERAEQVGGRLQRGLDRLTSKHALIGEVRGSGLFLGVELVKDRETLEPATREAAHLVNRLKDRGVLLSTDGPFENVLKIKPPMVLDDEDADMVVRMLDDELVVARDDSRA